LDKFGLIVEATGVLDLLMKVVKESGTNSTLLLLGFPYGKFEYNFEDVVGKDKIIVGSVGGEENDFDDALKILPELDLEPFSKTVLPLENFAQAWKLHNEAKQLKVILKA
jgi:D-arabinose 1-dehydrogenase-like Zn-dependent alcohol dehydrogenase